MSDTQAAAELRTSLMGGAARPSAANTANVKYSQGTTTPVQPPAEPLAAVDPRGTVDLTPDQALVTRAEAKIDGRTKKPACSNSKVHLMYGRGGGKSKRQSGGGKRGSKSGSKRSSGKAGKKGGKVKGKKGSKSTKGTKGTKGAKSRSKAGRSSKAAKGKGKKAKKSKK